jgi:hypothetical protein
MTIAAVTLFSLCAAAAWAQDATLLEPAAPVSEDTASAQSADLQQGTTQQYAIHRVKKKKKVKKKIVKRKKPAENDNYTGVTVLKVSGEDSSSGDTSAPAREENDPYAKPNEGNVEGGHYYAPGEDGPEPNAADIAKAAAEKEKKENEEKLKLDAGSNDKSSATTAKTEESPPQDTADDEDSDSDDDSSYTLIQSK